MIHAKRLLIASIMLVSCSQPADSLTNEELGDAIRINGDYIQVTITEALAEWELADSIEHRTPRRSKLLKGETFSLREGQTIRIMKGRSEQILQAAHSEDEHGLRVTYVPDNRNTMSSLARVYPLVPAARIQETRPIGNP